MIITFSAILFFLLLTFSALRKNAFFILHIFMMIAIAYYCENHLGWRMRIFSKPSLLIFILFHLPIINIITFMAYGRVKHCAKHGKWRIPEVQLHTLELMGGTIGAILGQKIFRHKNKKRSYLVTFWATIVIQLGIVFFILKYLIIF